jgi:hypothetical protein
MPVVTASEATKKMGGFKVWGKTVVWGRSKIWVREKKYRK